jgi:hypothetical protein
MPARDVENDQSVETERESDTQQATAAEMEVHETSEKRDVKIDYMYFRNMKTLEYNSFADAINALQKANQKEGNKDLLAGVYFCGLEEVPTFSLKSYLECDKDLKDYAEAFDDIYLSFNVLEWSLDQVLRWQSDNNEILLLGSQRIDFHHLQIQGSKVTLLSRAEAEPLRGSVDYYNMTLGFNDLSKKPSREALFKIVKLKFLDGEAMYNTEELKMLKEWFKSQGPAKMQKLYLEHILKGFPKKTDRYKNSPLQKLFVEMS